MSKLIGKLSAAAIIAAAAVAEGRGGSAGGRRPLLVPQATADDRLESRQETRLPSGVVTFLFTDIEGSTRLVKALREDYREVLAEHRRLVRAAIAHQAGYEVDTQGDAFFVAFDSAKQAVLCALEIQRALASHQWAGGALVRVRIGVHTGQAVPAGGAYIGLAVHRAARICAAAHGGQVLVSQPTQMIIEDEEEEPGFTLEDLGERMLKDLDRPVRLFQLAAPGLGPSEATPTPETPAIPSGSSLCPASWELIDHRRCRQGVGRCTAMRSGSSSAVSRHPALPQHRSRPRPVAA